MAYSYAAIESLADPTRRTIFELLSEKPRSVAELTRALPVTQSAVSQHLKVLREARLVAAQSKGASNIYRIDPRGLGEMRAWLDTMWFSALESFRNEIESTREE